jgi:xanthine/CO dehydrogenase XdhC/CoxF family maturation factor
VGLDLGGDLPASIALAMAAEITEHFNRHNGKYLKDKTATW